MPRGDLSTLEKDRLVSQVEQRIFGIKGIENMYVRSGAANQGSASDQIGSISLNYTDWRIRRPATEIAAEIRERLADIGGLDIRVSTASWTGHEQKPLDLVVTRANDRTDEGSGRANCQLHGADARTAECRGFPPATGHRVAT